jgi:hypothetical protein
MSPKHCYSSVEEVERARGPLLRLDREIAYHYLDLGLSAAAVAAVEGVHPNAIRHRLKAAGVPLRPRGAARRER